MHVQKRIATRVASGLVSLALVTTTAACGSSSGGATKSGGLTTVKVGNLVYTGTAPMQLGIKMGFFKQEGLDLKISEGDNPAAIAGQLTSGQADIGFTTTAFLATADSEGAGLQAVAPVDGLIDTKAPASGILVKSGSSIKSLKDLEGKKVGVVALGSELHVLTLADMAKNGADWKKLTPVQIPFPQMQQALDSGNVDAVVTAEPFLSASLANGGRLVAAPEVDMVPGGTVTAWAASKTFIAKNRKVVDGFRRAMEKTLQYSASHPEKVLAMIPSYAGLDAKALTKMNLGTVYNPKMNLTSIGTMSKLLKQFGFTKTEPTVDEMVSESLRNQ